MRTYYIYKVTDLTNDKIYIGKTSNFRKRKWQHERCLEKEDCLFHRAIKSHGKENFIWEIIDSTEGIENAYELEKKYIKEYNSYKPNGYNMTKGGAGGSMWNARPVVCLSLNGKLIRRYDSAGEAESDGYSNVLMMCKGLSYKTSKGRMFMFEDDYLENGIKKYIKPCSTSMRKVIQCDLCGNFISEFNSLKEASEKTGTNRTTISGVISGKYKSANGYIFVYKEDFPIKNIESYKPRKKGRKIAQLNPKTNEIIKVFDRISDAGKELGVNYKCIHKVLDLPDRMAYGYKWISQ